MILYRCLIKVKTLRRRFEIALKFYLKEGEISLDLPNLLNFSLCLSPSNDHTSNLKNCGNFAEVNKQYDSSDS